MGLDIFGLTAISSIVKKLGKSEVLNCLSELILFLNKISIMLMCVYLWLMDFIVFLKYL